MTQTPLLYCWPWQSGEEKTRSKEVAGPVLSTPSAVLMETSAPVITVDTSAPVITVETDGSTSTANAQDRRDSTPSLIKVMSSPRGLKHVDTLAVLRAEGEKNYQVRSERIRKGNCVDTADSRSRANRWLMVVCLFGLRHRVRVRHWVVSCMPHRTVITIVDATTP